MKYIEFPKTQERKKNLLDNFVFTTRVRIARNVEGLNFPLLLSEREKKSLEDKLCQHIKNLPYEIAVETMDSLPQEVIMIYLTNHILTHEFIRNGSTLAYETNGNWVILLNEDDHLRLTSIEEGYNAKNMYHRLSSVMIQIEDEVDLAYDENYGYLTSSIINVGTGLRISTLVNLFGLVAMKKIENFIDTAKKLGYSIMNITPESQESPLFYIYNIYSLGLSEEEIISEYDQFLTRAFHLEMDARNTYFSKKEEIELSIEELLDLSTKIKIEWQHILYYIALIDAMYKKFLVTDELKVIRGLIYHTKDDYLLNKHHVEKDSLDKVRLTMLKNVLSQVKYKSVKV